LFFINLSPEIVIVSGDKSTLIMRPVFGEYYSHRPYPIGPILVLIFLYVIPSSVVGMCEIKHRVWEADSELLGGIYGSECDPIGCFDCTTKTLTHTLTVMAFVAGLEKACVTDQVMVPFTVGATGSYQCKLSGRLRGYAKSISPSILGAGGSEFQICISSGVGEKVFKKFTLGGKDIEGSGRFVIGYDRTPLWEAVSKATFSVFKKYLPEGEVADTASLVSLGLLLRSFFDKLTWNEDNGNFEFETVTYLNANQPYNWTISLDSDVTAMDVGISEQISYLYMSLVVDEVSFTPTALPEPPSNLSASEGLYVDKVRITWDPSSFGESYQVYRSLTATGSKTVISTWQSDTVFDDNSAISGVEYYYWVKAKNTAGESYMSDYAVGYRAVPQDFAHITELFPSSGPKGSLIRIRGDNFGSKDGMIRFANGQIGTDVEWGTNEIYCRVPLGENLGGTVQVEPVRAGLSDGFESGNFTTLGWHSFGDSQWMVTNSDSYEGNWCAKSGQIPAGGSSTLEVTLTLPEAGSVNFHVKTSSNGILLFRIDGQVKEVWGSSFEGMDWTAASFQITAGQHTMTWIRRYMWPGSETGDCWLDYLTITVPGAGKSFIVTNPSRLYVDALNSERIEDGSRTYPFSKVQHAIDSSEEGDTILVKPGRYVEHLIFGSTIVPPGGYPDDKKDIVIRSQNIADTDIVARTIIDGGNDPCLPGYPQNYGPTVRFTGREGPDCLLAGLTIMGGCSSSGAGIFGAGFVTTDGTTYTGCSTHAGIINCVVTGNRADHPEPHNAVGGGIAVCDGEIRGCTISNNRSNGSGGGLYYCNGKIVQCEIRDNSAEYYGGGLYDCRGLITACRISDNAVGYSGGGLSNSPAKIVDCTVRGNSAGNRGGGLVSCAGELVNCEIAGNEASIYGGGLADCSSLITNCVIRGNCAVSGGGLYNCGGPIGNCLISNNVANFSGGGLEACGGSISSCTVIGNSVTDDSFWGGGGGLYNCRGKVRNCTISGNIAYYGGGIRVDCIFGNAPTVTSCFIMGNRAHYYGGGIYCFGNNGSPAIVDCIVSGNTAEFSGAGINSYQSCPAIVNCTIVGNRTVYNDGGALFASNGSNPMIENSVFWGNDARWGPEIGLRASSVRVSHSDIQGGQTRVFVGSNSTVIWEPGNIDIDPEFFEFGLWDPNGTVSDESDDFWVQGDYHLLRDSPCIDAGDPNYFPDVNNFDIYGGIRVIGSRVDMGADEYIPPELSDLNNDGMNNFKDFAVFADHFLDSCSGPLWCQSSDIDRNGIVTWVDFAAFTENWLEGR
jgi:hypothetical protein